MPRFKSVIIYLCFAVMMQAAKPFLGFTVFAVTHSIPATHLNICVKAFTKRKQEYVEGSSFDISSIQKKLADPVKQLLLHFSFLLSIIFPFVFFKAGNTSNRSLRRLHLSLAPCEPSYLLNGNLLI